MINVLPAHIFNSKIIDYQREGDRAGKVSPQARGMLTLVITRGGEMFSEQLVRQDACLGKAPYSLSHFKIYKSVLRELVKIVLLFCP